MDQSLTQVYFHLASQTAFLQRNLATHLAVFIKLGSLSDPSPFHKHSQIHPCIHIALSTY